MKRAIRFKKVLGVRCSVLGGKSVNTEYCAYPNTEHRTPNTSRVAWVLLLLAATTLSHAQGYARRTVQIKAGVVIAAGNFATGLPASNSNPFVWLNLDRNTHIKPTSWDIVNPFAPTVVTPAINTRWSAFPGGSPAAGTRINKTNAPYWEVLLDSTSDSEIAQYNVLLLSAYDRLTLNPMERDKLRKFMDSGGVLWVDLVSNGTDIDPINNLPISIMNAAGGVNPTINVFHPLLNSPNPISASLVEALQLDTSAPWSIRAFNPATDFGGDDDLTASLSQEFLKLDRVYGDSNGTIVGVGQVGDGFLVVTSRGVARAMNRVRTPGGGYVDNTTFTANLGTDLDRLGYDRLSDGVGKLVVNLVSLPDTYGQTGGNSHKSRGVSIDLNAPLMKRFSAVDAFDNFKQNHPPAVYKGLIAVSANDGTDNRIFLYDSNPSNDVDKDGDSDDGIEDYRIGAGRDLVWQSAPIPEDISAPVFIDVPNGLDQIVVSTASGNLLFYNVLPAGGAPIPAVDVTPAMVNPPAAVTATNPAPIAPTVHDGMVFAVQGDADGVGRAAIWIVDPVSHTILNGDWQISGGTSQLAKITGAVSVGYVPTGDNSGGFDRVIYAPTLSTTVGAGIASLWLGTKSETPMMVESAGTLTLTTRAALKSLNIYNPGGNNDLFAPRLTLVDAAGNNLPLNLYVSGGPTGGTGGILTYNLTGALPVDTVARLDYTIDWGDSSNYARIVRGQVRFPDAQKNRYVIGSPAISQSGKVFVSVGDLDAVGGGLYAFQEQTPGSFRLVYRYELYDQHTINLQGRSSVTYGETFLDTDDVKNITGGLLNGRLQSLQMVGAPAIKGNTVFVTAQATKTPGIPCAILIAFKADAEAPQIKSGDLGDSIVLVQPDLGASQSTSAPATYVTMRPGQFDYDRDAGTITFNNMMSSTVDTMQNAFSVSQPVIIRRAGSPDTLLQPERSGGRWSPLLWYTVYQGMGGATSPLVTGESVFVSGQSSLPSILTTGTFTPVGMVNAIDAEISPNDAHSFPNANRPWMTQVYALTGTGPIDPNPNILWPQTIGVTTPDEFIQRLLQTTMPGTTESYGVVGGSGSLVAWGGNSTGPSSLFSFSRTDFIVADEGRIARFDPSGNPLWSTDTFTNSGTQMDVGNSAILSKIVKPVRAYPLGSNEVIVVDAGANRVLRFDESGRVTRNIEQFQLDPNAVPDGYRAGEPLTLNDPRDVTVYTEYFRIDASTLEYRMHYVIVDRGNYRILDLMDRYSADSTTGEILGPVQVGGINQLGMLYWHSPTGFRDRKLDATSIVRMYDPTTNRYVYTVGLSGTSLSKGDAGIENIPAYNNTVDYSIGAKVLFQGQPYEAIADPIAGTRPSDTAFWRALAGASRSTSNGGIVIIDPITGGGITEINEIAVPDLAQDAFWNGSAFLSPYRESFQKRVGPINSLTMQYVYIPNHGTRLTLMYTDNTGAYEIFKPVPGDTTTYDPRKPDQWVVNWMMLRTVYRNMRGVTAAPRDTGAAYDGSPFNNPKDFLPMFARRLDNGEVLLVNGYFGQNSPSGEFKGEVIVVDGEMDSNLFAATTPPVGYSFPSGFYNPPGNGLTNRGFSFGKTNLGFGTGSIRFVLPPIQGARGIVLPVFADRR